MFSKKLSDFPILLVLLLTSCASIFNQPEVDWKNGAKRAWIVSFYTPDAGVADLPPCLASLPNTEFTTRHFVKVGYKHVRKMLITVAELPDALHAKVDDQVELWPADCSKGQLSRISRILPSSAQ